MYWSVNLAAKLSFKAEPHLTEASDVLVVPTDFSGHAEIIPLQKRHLVLKSPPWCPGSSDQQHQTCPVDALCLQGVQTGTYTAVRV